MFDFTCFDDSQNVVVVTHSSRLCLKNKRNSAFGRDVTIDSGLNKICLNRRKISSPICFSRESSTARVDRRHILGRNEAKNEINDQNITDHKSAYPNEPGLQSIVSMSKI